jgi:hypothetical protein
LGFGTSGKPPLDSFFFYYDFFFLNKLLNLVIVLLIANFFFIWNYFFNWFGFTISLSLLFFFPIKFNPSFFYCQFFSLEKFLFYFINDFFILWFHPPLFLFPIKFNLYFFYCYFFFFLLWQVFKIYIFKLAHNKLFDWIRIQGFTDREFLKFNQV